MQSVAPIHIAPTQRLLLVILPLIPNHKMRGLNTWHDTFPTSAPIAPQRMQSRKFPLIYLAVQHTVSSIVLAEHAFSQNVRMNIWRIGQHHSNRCRVESGTSISCTIVVATADHVHANNTRPTQVQWGCVKLWGLTSRTHIHNHEKTSESMTGTIVTQPAANTVRITNCNKTTTELGAMMRGQARGISQTYHDTQRFLTIIESDIGSRIATSKTSHRHDCSSIYTHTQLRTQTRHSPETGHRFTRVPAKVSMGLGYP